MPSPTDLVAGVIRFVGEILGASSLRFETGPTLVVLGVLLVFLQLVARPPPSVPPWDGRASCLPRSMR